jgi:hypothetical protein
MVKTWKLGINWESVDGFHQEDLLTKISNDAKTPQIW